jgi:hypothetical protein
MPTDAYSWLRGTQTKVVVPSFLSEVPKTTEVLYLRCKALCTPNKSLNLMDTETVP